MSGELQTIPARHGVATFVPRGRTIKVINTYGKQVVSMWAFSLGPPPEDEEEGGPAEEVDEKEVEKEAESLKKAIEEDGEKESESAEKDEEQPKAAEKGEGSGEKARSEDVGDKSEGTRKETESTAKETEKTDEDADDPPEQAPDTPENEKATESTAKQTNKRTWASYLPSIPYRNKGKAGQAEPEQKPNAEDEKAQNEANTKKWSSYLPTGKGFSNYVPNVQVPDTKDVVNAFKTTHARDPNKSYAEQLFDFSKTPVGAGTIAAATGSGYASSVYAAYSAYSSAHPSSASQPPMEYLSLPHTRAFSHKLVPEVDDELLTNLRNPIITLVEDTSPGAHDTLTAACDANLYRALNVDKPEEHASCAVNLVLALKELNENAGLKGAKAIGADITVNIAPTPLHLFMNAPLQLDEAAQSEGTGAKGAVLKVEEPKGKKRSFVRFRAERDVVVIFSSCPMDVGSQNGGRCMAANFMVEDVQEGEDLASSVSSIKQKKPAPRKLDGKPDSNKAKPKAEKKPEPKQEEPKKEEKPQQQESQPKKPAPRKLSTPAKSGESSDAQKPKDKKEESPIPEEPKDDEAPAEDPKEEEQKPKKKPKKLQVRGSGGTSTPSKSS